MCVCACVCVCVIMCVCFDCVLILCFVTGHVLHSGETAHKRACYVFIMHICQKMTTKQSQSLCARENVELCEYQILIFRERVHTHFWLVALNLSCSVHFSSKSLQFSSHCLPHLKETPGEQALLALSVETVKKLHLQQL